MSDFDSEYWKLINNFEDILRYGRTTDRPLASMRLVRSGSSFGKPDTLESVASEVDICRKCRLCEKRIKSVPGMGVSSPDVLVVGEGPGADEDISGLPFVGKAGQYLDKWLEAIGMSRHKDCFIANVVKCRPPENRDPRDDEIEACLPYLRRQIEILRPRIILTVGRIAAITLIGEETSLGRLRGRTYRFNGIPLIPTYHPSGVLRDPSLRGPVWEDLKRLKAELENIKNG